MIKKILAVLEQRENNIKKSSYEVLTIAKKIAAEFGAEAEGIVLGGNISDFSNALSYGLNITHLNNNDLEKYSSSAYSELIFNYCNEVDADLIVFANTSLSKDLAPLISVKLKAGLIMDAVNYSKEGDDLIFTRPVYAGKSLVEVKFKTDKKVLTIRPNVFQPLKSENVGTLNTKEVSSVNLKTRVTEIKKSEGKLDVAEADIIVSGGRGLKGPENFHLVESLAEAFGAAVGASRAVVDAGWRSHNEQVGQTGKTVSPSLYVACGISGAIQHLAGMSSSKYIVAINKDKDAPIFTVADFGITGDVFEILPALTEEIKKVRS